MGAVRVTFLDSKNILQGLGIFFLVMGPILLFMIPEIGGQKETTHQYDLGKEGFVLEEISGDIFYDEVSLAVNFESANHSRALEFYFMNLENRNLFLQWCEEQGRFHALTRLQELEFIHQETCRENLSFSFQVKHTDERLFVLMLNQGDSQEFRVEESVRWNADPVFCFFGTFLITGVGALLIRAGGLARDKGKPQVPEEEIPWQEGQRLK